MAQPNAFLTVTGLQRTWAAAQSVMQRLRRWLRRAGHDGEWAYHLEPNPSSDGAHAHIWWRGAPVDVITLAEGAVSVGAQFDAHVEPDVFMPAGYRVPSLEYGLKEVLVDRPLEPTQLWPKAEAYLALNGGKLVNASRGFWVDWRGEPVVGGVVRARVMAHTWTGTRGHTHRNSGVRTTDRITKAFPDHRSSGTFPRESCERGRVRTRPYPQVKRPLVLTQHQDRPFKSQEMP